MHTTHVQKIIKPMEGIEIDFFLLDNINSSPTHISNQYTPIYLDLFLLLVAILLSHISLNVVHKFFMAINQGPKLNFVVHKVVFHIQVNILVAIHVYFHQMLHSQNNSHASYDAYQLSSSSF